MERQRVQLYPARWWRPRDRPLLAGEWASIDLLGRVTGLLTTAMRYEVPTQDLQIDLSRMPTLPNSRFVISNVTSA